MLFRFQNVKDCVDYESNVECGQGNKIRIEIIYTKNVKNKEHNSII